MKAITMCFSLLQISRCKVGNSLWESVYKLGRTSGRSPSYVALCSNNRDYEGGHSKMWTRRTLHTKGIGSHANLICNTILRREASTKADSHKLGTTSKVQRRRKVSVKNKVIAESRNAKEAELDQYYSDLAKLATVICFDIETTGFIKDRDMIIEFACQDLKGGMNSTFQSLVNPECCVTNTQIHGISSQMVNRNDVPRMKEFIPILLAYVRSRQIPGGVVVLVAHNGRKFDVPFLKKEFSRCSYEIPQDWSFYDTLPLARSVMKNKELEDRPKLSLQALREYYDIPLCGQAHRALSDVQSLSLILQRLTHELKFPVSDLIRESFK